MKLKLIHSVTPPTLSTRQHLERELEIEMERLRSALDKGAKSIRDDLIVLKEVAKNPITIGLLALAGGFLMGRMTRHRTAR